MVVNAHDNNNKNKTTTTLTSSAGFKYNSNQFILTMKCLQCFDAVGWAAGRASGKN